MSDEKKKLQFLKPEKGNSIGQWLIEERISAGFPSPADDFKEVRISLDEELVAIDASHLIEPSVTYIGFRKGTYLKELLRLADCLRAYH